MNATSRRVDAMDLSATPVIAPNGPRRAARRAARRSIRLGTKVSRPRLSSPTARDSSLSCRHQTPRFECVALVTTALKRLAMRSGARAIKPFDRCRAAFERVESRRSAQERAPQTEFAAPPKA